MKISVIIGVIHMTLGVFVKATNSLYYKKKVEFWFETIPQLIFLVLVFGYMDFLIIFKWLKPWGYGNVHAPSIITSMINLPLMVGKTVFIFLSRINNAVMVVNRCGGQLNILPKTQYKNSFWLLFSCAFLSCY